jgi:hypothetical protein
MGTKIPHLSQTLDFRSLHPKISRKPAPAARSQNSHLQTRGLLPGISFRINGKALDIRLKGFHFQKGLNHILQAPSVSGRKSRTLFGFLRLLSYGCHHSAASISCRSDSVPWLGNVTFAGQTDHWLIREVANISIRPSRLERPLWMLERLHQVLSRVGWPRFLSRITAAQLRVQQRWAFVHRLAGSSDDKSHSRPNASTTARSGARAMTCID